MIVDKSKLKRERQKNRKSIYDCRSKTIESLYYDSRKDMTKIVRKIGGKYHPDTEIQEHIVFVEEPDSIYVGHVTPSSGTALSITNSITNFFLKNEIDTQNLCVIGCDSTNVYKCWMEKRSEPK